MASFSKQTLAVLFFSLIISACNTNDDDGQKPAVMLPKELAFTTGLPVIVIDTPDGCAISSKSEWVMNANIAFYTSGGEMELQATASIRGRGNVTWDRYPKKPYSIKLDKKASLAGMKPAKRWVLLANWGDRTLLRNDVAFEIARHTSLEWTPSGIFVEFVLNGVYCGSYFLCEKIQIGENRLNITEMTQEDEDEVSITGGYLMEIDAYFDEVNKFHSNIYNLPYQFRSPDEGTLSQKMFEYMEQYVNQMEYFLSDDKELQRGSYRELIDIKTFADWWIINELCLNKDVCKLKSIYMYKERNQPMKAGPVWDFDFATFTPRSDIYVAERFPYLQRLFLNQDFQAMVCERWKELRPMLDSIPDYIDMMADRLRMSAEQNIQLWPIKKKSNGDENLTYQEAIERMKASFLLRVQMIEQYIGTFTNESPILSPI